MPWKRELWIGYGVFWIGLLLYVRLIKPLSRLRHPYQVVAVQPERGSCWTVVLKPDGHRGMQFLPGQFAWLTAWRSPFSYHEHPFSFSSSAMNTDTLSFTIKELGDFSSRIKDLVPGHKVYLDGAFGAFSIDRHSHAEGYVFIAGGIGISPIMSMLRTLADRNDNRPIILCYANTTWESVTFREEIDALQKRLNLQVIYVLSTPHREWQGEKGYVSQQILERYLPEMRERNRREYFICGPKPMMDKVERALIKLGVWVDDYHSERFNLV